MNIPLTVLGIIDGFGYSQQQEGNAIAQARTPSLDYLWSYFPHFLLKAAEEEVGLGFGEVGNSEVGHITIGSGRVVAQNLSRINKAIEDGTFFDNKFFIDSVNNTRTNQTALHLLGIISAAGVHGHLNHILALIQLAAKHKVKNLYLHLILDGRDSGPQDTPLYLKEIYQTIQKYKVGHIATITGRAFAMDRNNNWEFTSQAYFALMGRSKYSFPSVDEAIKHYYSQGIDDEHIPPTIIASQNQPPVTLKQNDSVIFTNFREDRARQLTKALALPGFDNFDRGTHPKLHVTTMTTYEKSLPVNVAFSSPDMPNCISDILAKNEISQIHIAETEKYGHVTYFFNGGREAKRPLETYHLIPSLKPDQFKSNPQMSASDVTDAIIKSIDLGYQFIVFNFANCDMLGHTGDLPATIKAVEFLDSQFSRIWKKVSSKNGYLFITADHGNSEMMLNPKTKQIYKEHTVSPIPFIAAHASLLQNQSQPQKVLTGSQVSGLLSDIAPTLLNSINLAIPPEMTGTNLLAQ